MYSRNPISLPSLMMMIIVTDTAQDYQASRRWGQRWTSDIRWTHSSEGGWWWQWWSLPPPSSGECEPHWLWSCAPRATSSKMPAPGRSKLQNNYVRRWVWCLRDALPPFCQSLACNLNKHWEIGECGLMWPGAHWVTTDDGMPQMLLIAYLDVCVYYKPLETGEPFKLILWSFITMCSR